MTDPSPGAPDVVAAKPVGAYSATGRTARRPPPALVGIAVAVVLLLVLALVVLLLV